MEQRVIAGGGRQKRLLERQFVAERRRGEGAVVDFAAARVVRGWSGGELACGGGLRSTDYDLHSGLHVRLSRRRRNHLRVRYRLD